MTLDPKFNKLPKVTDFNNASAVFQQNYEEGFRTLTGEELVSEIKDYIEVTGVKLEPISSGQLPTPPIGQVRTMSVRGVGPWTHPTLPDGRVSMPNLNYLGEFYFDGSIWKLTNQIELPKGEDGNSVLPFFDRNKADGYSLNAMVSDDDGKLYKSLKDNNRDLLSEKSSWFKVGGSGDYVFEKPSANIVEIHDSCDSIVASWNAEGEFETKFKKSSIDPLAVEGLPEIIDKTDAIQFEPGGTHLAEFRSGEKILGFIDSEGSWNVPNIKTYHSGSNQVSPEIGKETNVYIPKSKFYRIDIWGVLPTDTSENRESVRNWVDIYLGDSKIVSFNTEMSIQGNGSIMWWPTNLTIDFYNKNWESVNVKFGAWIPKDSFQVKAYQSDKTHSRDAGGGRFWRHIASHRPHPYNFIKNITGPSPITFSKHRDITADALFYGDTVPVAIYHNGLFRNLGSLKIKKTRENYAMESSTQDHILLDSSTYESFLGRGYSDFGELTKFYEVKNPKTPSVVTQDKILDWFNWVNGVMNNTVDLASSYQDRINLVSWLDFIIVSNVIGHWDTIGNNLLLGFYDGQHAELFIHDMDKSAGITNYDTIEDSNNGIMNSDPFINKLRITFDTSLKSRYTALRNNGVITTEVVRKLYSEVVNCVPRNIYELDSKNPRQTQEYPTLDQIYRYISSRIDFLDGIWKL